MKKTATFVLTLVLVFGLSFCGKSDKNQRKSVSDYNVATFEYIEDEGYKLITSEISSLYTFDSLILKPSEMDFDGKWVYRLTFNPQKYSNNSEEYVILFGEQCVSINGKIYVGDGLPYSKIMDWVAGKYKYFDYDLITE